ncbi:hypothetical protein SCHPADRAFT_940960 [Schizopora paradoxa]|uniref:Fungal STAND N-terminal Goodbye domain-containing protein n=1 Tax=Schizopora paradoxa TaxID=27342 RepID=A0A0H2RTK9_9AGAM|nr:hypothetical protein SCHPADRAFT_940960 [Schizopora paradoxa]
MYLWVVLRWFAQLWDWIWSSLTHKYDNLDHDLEVRSEQGSISGTAGTGGAPSSVNGEDVAGDIPAIPPRAAGASKSANGEDAARDIPAVIPRVERASSSANGEDELGDISVILPRAESIFLDKTDGCSEDDLKKALGLLNDEIMNCTMAITDEWLSVKESQNSNNDLRPALQTQLATSSKTQAFVVIGDAMRERIERARALSPAGEPPANELGDVLEHALRAWTAYCMATYIFDLFPPGPTIGDEPAVQFVARGLAETKEEAIVAKWNTLSQEAKSAPDAGLRDMFGRLVDIYCPRGKLATALRWRELAYGVVHSKGNYSKELRDEKQRQLLEGMRAIIDLAGTVDNFPKEDRASSVFDKAKILADLIHKEFMSALYEIYAVKPGVEYDESQMKGSDEATTRRRVICTTELGLRKVQKPSAMHEYPFALTTSGVVLERPEVLL